jgi:pyrimidine-specific ribonucleoside hydrolase
MADLGRPAPAGAPDPRHGVELLRDLLLAAAATGERLTLVPLAPLTNVALLLRSYPQAAAGLERIVFMGGSALVGNVTAAAEFNVWNDPEAAAITLEAAGELGVPVTMYGLDVFMQVTVTRDQALELAVRGGAAARLGAALVGFACDRWGADAATLGDAGAVCAVLDRSGIGIRRLPVRVELAGTWTRGQTVVDQREGALDRERDSHGHHTPADVDVALTVDGPRYAALWLDTLAAHHAP